MKNVITLSREQVEVLVRAQSPRFPTKVRKGEWITQYCGHPACRFKIEWMADKKEVVDWHEDLITHIFKEEHYVVTSR